MRYTTGQQEFVRRTLTFLQILGRRCGLRMHYRGHRELQYYTVQIDGPLAAMQMLDTELIPYLSGAVLIGGSLTKRQRVRVGSQLVVAVSDAIEGITDHIHSMVGPQAGVSFALMPMSPRLCEL